MPDQEGDEFYVGYLDAATPGIARRTRAAVIAYIIMSMLVATVCVGFITRTGRGTWTDSSFRPFQGVLREFPYPIIELDEPIIAGASRTALLVDFGKRGAQQRAQGLDGARVTVTGTVLERDGRCMIELAPESDAVRADAPGKAAPGATGDWVSAGGGGSVSITGEIVDPKCFLGAMKPGEGKTHKDCAVRCISGGIPPSLVSWDADGRASYYVLTDEQGRPAGRLFLGVVGEPVVVSGELGRIGDLMVIRVARNGVRRL